MAIPEHSTISVNVVMAYTYFEKYVPETQMPDAVRTSVLRGVRFTNDNLETQVLDQAILYSFSPEIAKLVGVCDFIPTVRRKGTYDQFAYHPTTGKYLGKFSTRASR